MASCRMPLARQISNKTYAVEGHVQTEIFAKPTYDVKISAGQADPLREWFQ